MKEKIYVFLIRHDFEYDLRALLKAFYLNKEIVFINEKALAKNQSLLIESILKENQAITKVIKDGQVLIESIVDARDIEIEISDKKRVLKLAVKQSVLRALLEISKIKMPWGVLTGIRPTKIVHELIDKEVRKENILDILKNQYKLNDEKARLITDIALEERKHIYPLDKEKFSLYISIPFCPSRCLYCSFPSNDIENSRKFVDLYSEKLLIELIEMSKVMKGKVLDTVYIGGGTPTALPLKNLENIIESVYKYFGRGMREFTVEAGRPDTIDLEILKMLKKQNIKRISINPQSMNDDTLKKIGRNHTIQDIIRTFSISKELAFESINMDLIVGLPGEDESHIIKTMEYIRKLNPENLTVHTMALKRSSRLNKKIDEYDLTNQLKLENMLDITKSYARELGYKPYYMYRQKQILGNFENIGYSKEGFECIYNMLIMEEKQTIIAIGAGGASKIFNTDTGEVKRVPNLKDLREYINRVEEMVERKRSEVYVNTSTKGY